MTTAPNLTMPTTIAAADPRKALDVPRRKGSPHRFTIDHPNPARGEQLMATALGLADRDSMEGLLRQLVMASVNGGGGAHTSLTSVSRNALQRSILLLREHLHAENRQAHEASTFIAAARS